MAPTKNATKKTAPTKLAKKAGKNTKVKPATPVGKRFAGKSQVPYPDVCRKGLRKNPMRRVALRAGVPSVTSRGYQHAQQETVSWLENVVESCLRNTQHCGATTVGPLHVQQALCRGIPSHRMTLVGKNCC